MSEDLESTLDELGPAYREVVGRLRAAQEVEPTRRGIVRVNWRRWTASLVAATILVVVGFSVLTSRTPVDSSSVAGPYTLALDLNDTAIGELVRTQRADGSWDNDFLTRQNAAALKDVASAKVAYRRAVRYLRAKGLTPLSPEELRHRGDLAARLLARS